MKYLKKFNEATEIESAKDKFCNWLKENIKYTDEDILYYFSEFTDEHEYEYEVTNGEVDYDLSGNVSNVFYNFDQAEFE